MLIVLSIVVILTRPTDVLGDHHHAPKACQHSAVKSITEDERHWAQEAADSAVREKKIPIVILPLVISRLYAADNRDLSVVNPKLTYDPQRFNYHWVDRNLKPVANPKDLTKIWGAHVDVPILALSKRKNILVAILSDILKQHDNNRSIELVLPGWFPKPLRDAMIQNRQSVKRLLAKHLISRACLDALVLPKTRASDFQAAELIHLTRNREWAPVLADIFWRMMKRRPLKKNPYAIHFWGWRFQQMSADGQGTREIGWLESPDPNLRATGALILGALAYNPKIDRKAATEWLPKLRRLLQDPSARVRREAMLAIARIASTSKRPFSELGVEFKTEPVAEALVGANMYCQLFHPTMASQPFYRARPCQQLKEIMFLQPDLTAKFLSDRIGDNRTALIWRTANPIIDQMAQLVIDRKIPLSPNVRRVFEYHGLRVWGTPHKVAKAIEVSGVVPADPLNRGYYHFALKQRDLARKAFSKSGDAIKIDLQGTTLDLQRHAIKAVKATGFKTGLKLAAELIRDTNYEQIAKMGAFSKHKLLRAAANDWARKRGKRWTVVEVPGVGIPGVSPKKKK